MSRDREAGRNLSPGRKEEYVNFIGLIAQFEALISSHLAKRKVDGADAAHERRQVLNVLAFVCGNYVRRLQKLGDQRPFWDIFISFGDLIRSSYALQPGKRPGRRQV